MDESAADPPLTADAIVTALEKWLGDRHTGFDYVKIGKIMAAADTAMFVRDEMPAARIFPNRRLLHDAALKARVVDGLILEFGVAGGQSINYLANALPNQKVHGFDSFEGLPEAWTSTYQKGHFSQEGLPEVKDNVQLHVGWFDHSLPQFLAEHPGPVSYLHIDCDLYSSTATIFGLLEERIVPGTVIVFDEYFNYPTWREHEYKAFKEFVERKQVKFQYLGGVNRNKQVSVLIDAIG